MCIAAHAQSTQADLRGIYLYTNDVSIYTSITGPNAAPLVQSFSIPGVDGVALVIGWNSIEPAMGQYQWTILDQWIGLIAGLGKKIDLVIPAGSSTPTWLFQPKPAGAGATELSFTVSPHSGQTGVCDAVNIAAPWDPVFLAQWDAMLSALSAHLKSAGTYSNITLVRLTGINRTTEELRLPAETAASTGLPCVSNSITAWQHAGYLPSLLLQGWNAVLGSFMKSFPDKSFAVSIIPNDAFPGIAQDGSVITGQIGDEDEPLLMSAANQLPGRLVVQFDFLMPGEVASTVVTGAAENYGTMAAFQTNEYLGSNGAACSEPVTNPTPCTSSTFLQLLDVGVSPLGQSNPLRSHYIEVFHDNAVAFPSDILQAHFLLAPPMISLVANAEGEAPTIAPNTWVEIKGEGLSLTGDSRIWQTSDFANNKMPTQLDGISATVNGKSAYVYYISPSQVNILTPPDAIAGSVSVVLANTGPTTASFTVQAQSMSPSFFVFGGGPYVAAVHADGSYIGSTTLYPGLSTPAKPGETIMLYANGFGQTTAPVVSGSSTQGGTLSTLPVVTIGGVTAQVQYAGLVSVGEFQFNVTIPTSLSDADQPIVAKYNNVTTQAGTLITVHH